MFVEFETREMFKLMSRRTLPRCFRNRDSKNGMKKTNNKRRRQKAESRNRTALESTAKATKLYQGVAVVNKFEDEAYNRVGYTIVSKFTPNAVDGSGAFRKAVVAVVKAAFDSIDLELHCGTHPRLRVVDHISFHPLAQTSLNGTARLAKLVATDIGSSHQVQATPTEGVVVVGATQWVDNYNVPIFSNKIIAVRRISRRVSGRGGGISSVQAMALAHGED
ncbi:uncharacterized protein LOC113307638 [Papaver somniferum]|uniref:uncharacterized protein LOC113307638 n=1 Tax=Papaver somniferum TaxID=3469 RepID=UPI000E704E32|nr:uncharacterized protein LOC113307638 [Papaver somniferum]